LKLIEKIHQIKLHSYLKFGLMIMGYFILLWFRWLMNYTMIFGYGDETWIQFIFYLIPIGGFILLMIGTSKTEDISSGCFWSAILGLIYISLSIGLLIYLFLEGFSLYQNNYPSGVLYQYAPKKFFHWSIPIIIIFSLWINDTMAYIIGSLIGKTPLSKISPKKTWEGTVGGLVLTIGVACLVAKLVDFNILKTSIIAAIASIAGTFGDLFESKLKRMAGVKDSGHIMPGHGGFLDRFDSLLFAIPFVWLYVYFFMR
jgi:phosphatidate cytidylyltransferase